jgi:hypothetical protein
MIGAPECVYWEIPDSTCPKEDIEMDPLNNINRTFRFVWSKVTHYVIIGREGGWYRIKDLNTGNILKLQVNTVLNNCTDLY